MFTFFSLVVLVLSIVFNSPSIRSLQVVFKWNQYLFIKKKLQIYNIYFKNLENEIDTKTYGGIEILLLKLFYAKSWHTQLQILIMCVHEKY